MSRQGYEDVVYYVGPEVDHTKAFSMKTLYVIGVRNPEQVVEFASENKCKHVRLGVMNSFQKNKRLLEIIESTMREGFLTTLEVTVTGYQWVLDNVDQSILHDKNFILVVSVELPKIENGCANLTVKVDDGQWGESNSGTWTYPSTELMDSNRFTSWDDHMTDEVVWTEADQKKLINDRKNANRK